MLLIRKNPVWGPRWAEVIIVPGSDYRVEGNVEVDMKSEITPLGEFASLEDALLAAAEFSENVRIA